MPTRRPAAALPAAGRTLPTPARDRSPWSAARRSVRAVSAGLAAVAALAGCSAGAAPSGSASSSASPGSSGSVAPATTGGAGDAAELAALVQAYGRSLDAATAAGAPSGWQEQVAGDAPDLRARVTRQVAAMRAVGVDGYALTLDPSTLQVQGATATMVAVGETHLRGAAPGRAPLTLSLRARRTPQGWRLVDDRGPDTMPQPWDLPGVRRVDVPGALVLGDAPPERMRWYAQATAQAWRDIAPAWPRRPEGSPVVVAPATVAEAAAQLRRDPGSLTGLAALTVGSLAPGRPALGDRVVVNPDSWDRLTEAGRATILRHELVHVAVRGTTTGTVPQWLAEGYATWASWPDGRVPDQLLARARRWTPAQLAPAGPPTDAEVEHGDLTHAYDVSALLVDDMVRRSGRPAVVALYEAVASGRSVDAASRTALGVPFATVLDRWRARLRAVAAPAS